MIQADIGSSQQRQNLAVVNSGSWPLCGPNNFTEEVVG
jgi:hypothetical protein